MSEIVRNFASEIKEQQALTISRVNYLILKLKTFLTMATTTIKMTREQFIEYISNNSAKGRLVSVEMDTIPTMNKGRGANRNPYLGRVRKISNAVYRFNSDYERTINARLKREGKEPNFVAEAIKGRVWLVPNQLETNDKGEVYLRLYQHANGVRKVRYIIDGRDATNEEITDLKRWLVKPTKSAKQIAHGLSNTYEVRSPKVANIVTIRMNKTEIILTD